MNFKDNLAMKLSRINSLIGLLFLLIYLGPLPAANAILGGTPAIGNQIVVGLLGNKDATSSGCSGALVAPRVVMTAAHCLTRDAERIWISEPGTDLKNTSTTRIQVEKYFIPSTFQGLKPKEAIVRFRISANGRSKSSTWNKQGIVKPKSHSRGVQF